MGKDEETGRDKYHRETKRGKKAAQSRLNQLLVDADKGQLVDSPKVTLGEYATAWLRDDLKPRVKDTTYDMHEQMLRVHIEPSWLAKKRLDKVRPTDLKKFYAEMRNGPRADAKPGHPSDRTIYHVHEFLRELFNYAVAMGDLAASPAVKGTAPPKGDRRRVPKVWTPEQTAAFLSAASSHRLCAAFVMFLTTGMRRGEVLGLHWSEVDFDRKWLSVQWELTISKEKGLTFDTPKTDASRRMIALSPLLVDALYDHFLAQIKERKLFAEEYKNQDLVFCTETGGPLHRRRFARTFEYLISKAGVPKIAPHDMRHTHVTLLLSANVNPKVVADRLGHAEVNTTLNVYSHLLPTIQKEAAETIDSVISAADEERKRRMQ